MSVNYFSFLHFYYILQAYVIELESDIDLCIKRNIHKRTAHDINNIMRSWVKTPCDQILLDIRSLFSSPSQSEVLK